MSLDEGSSYKSRIRQKIEEPSVESLIIHFLIRLLEERSLPTIAFTGGIAIGAYLGHLPRRLADIDLVILSKDFSALREILHRYCFHTVCGPRSHIVSEFCSSDSFFDIDVHQDAIILANPPEWEALGRFDLTDALHRRQMLTLHAVSRRGTVTLPTVPISYHFLMKLLPPIEPTNLHDILYMILSPCWLPHTSADVGKLLLDERFIALKPLFSTRLFEYCNIFSSSIWHRSMSMTAQHACEQTLRELSRILPCGS